MEMLRGASKGRGKTYERSADEHHRSLVAQTVRVNGERKRTQIPGHNLEPHAAAGFQALCHDTKAQNGNALPIFLL
jgi:hypothetical protein